MSSMAAMVSVEVQNSSGYPHEEPVSFGVPVIKGVLHDAGIVKILHKEQPVAFTPRVLQRWPDNSVKWLHLDCWVRFEGKNVLLDIFQDGQNQLPVFKRKPLQTSSHLWRCGGIELEFGKQHFTPFDSMAFSGKNPLKNGEKASWVNLETEKKRHPAKIDSVDTQVSGHGKFQRKIEGIFPGTRKSCRFCAETIIWPEGLVRIDFTLWNPKPAKHPHGIWELGDQNSFSFKSLVFGLNLPEFSEIQWKVHSCTENKTISGLNDVSIYQASSGGENWDFDTHLDRNNSVPMQFKGCKWEGTGNQGQCNRAFPSLNGVTDSFSIQVVLQHFWEKFPSILKAGQGQLEVGLFPETGYLHELQPGEKLTRTFFLNFTDAMDSNSSLDWVNCPAVWRLDPDYVASTRAWPYLIPVKHETESQYLQMTSELISGVDSLSAKREQIDEYGWRNFGDVFADHEKRYYKQSRPLVSHYNNQYDLAFGLQVRFLREANPVWMQYANDLIRHVRDVDLYHTQKDRPVYNLGYFWHTDHYSTAGRATHRCYSSEHPSMEKPGSYGGGPSNEHNYSTGFLLHYLLTGDERSKEAVLQLGTWTIGRERQLDGLPGLVCPEPTGFSTMTFSEEYHGPGRGAGNSIVTLMDAYLLTLDRRWLHQAEEWIKRCIHPQMNPGQLHLTQDLEGRWSYLVFLQALGKYLQVKFEQNLLDETFEYGRACLDRFAEWMLDQEIPYMDNLDKVEFPTETWPAHDMRKSNIFDYAAQFGHPARKEAYLKKAAYFYRRSLQDMHDRFDSWRCTRPQAILLGTGYLRPWFRENSPGFSSSPVSIGPWHIFRPFVPAKMKIKSSLKTIPGISQMVKRFLSPAAWKKWIQGRKRSYP